MPLLGDALLAAAVPMGVMHVLGAVLCSDSACASTKAASLSLLGPALQRGHVRADAVVLTVLLLAASSPHAALRVSAVELATVRCPLC